MASKFDSEERRDIMTRVRNLLRVCLLFELNLAEAPVLNKNQLLLLTTDKETLDFLRKVPSIANVVLAGNRASRVATFPLNDVVQVTWLDAVDVVRVSILFDNSHMPLPKKTMYTRHEPYATMFEDYVRKYLEINKHICAYYTAMDHLVTHVNSYTTLQYYFPCWPLLHKLYTGADFVMPNQRNYKSDLSPNSEIFPTLRDLSAYMARLAVVGRDNIFAKAKRVDETQYIFDFDHYQLCARFEYLGMKRVPMRNI